MKITSSNRLVIGLLLSATLWDCQDLEASRKMEAVSRSTDMDRAMSANESLLLRFEKEKDELLKNRNKDVAPHLLKNKVKILDNKITFLRQEIERTRKFPPKKMAMSSSVVAKRPAPILKLKAYAPSEPRHRIFLAYSPEIARPMASARSEGREAPQQTASVIDVASRGSMLPEDRESASEAIVTERSKGRAKTGAEWRSMSRADKEIYMLSVLGNLSRHDIFLERPYRYYIDAVDKALQDDPSRDGEYVHKIVLRSAYEGEPEVRKDIEKVWK